MKAAILLALISAAHAATTWPTQVVAEAPNRIFNVTWPDGSTEMIPFMSVDHFEMAPPEGESTKVLVLVDRDDRRVPIGATETTDFARFLSGTVVRKPLTQCEAPTCGVEGDLPALDIRVETMTLDLSASVDPMALSARNTGPTDIMGGPIRHIDQAEISKAVEPHSEVLLGCYQRVLSSNPRLTGKVTVEMTVQSDGSVSDARVRESTLNNLTVESCLLREFRKITFPKPEGATFTTVAHTLNFEKLE